MINKIVKVKRRVGQIMVSAKRPFMGKPILKQISFFCVFLYTSSCAHTLYTFFKFIISMFSPKSKFVQNNFCQILESLQYSKTVSKWKGMSVAQYQHTWLLQSQHLGIKSRHSTHPNGQTGQEDRQGSFCHQYEWTRWSVVNCVSLGTEQPDRIAIYCIQYPWVFVFCLQKIMLPYFY